MSTQIRTVGIYILQVELVVIKLKRVRCLEHIISGKPCEQVLCHKVTEISFDRDIAF